MGTWFSVAQWDVDSREGSRGQSETIGLILVFGMVLAGGILIVTFGSAAIEQTQSGLSEQRAQKAMTQFDSKSALVALGNADTQAIEFPQRGGENLQVKPGAGEMTVKIEELSTGNVVTEDWTLGELRFKSGDTTIAYQGGGVWRKGGESRESVMISPPEFHFRNGTLTLPIITVDGATSVGERVSVAESTTDTWFPESSATPPRLNPLDDHVVTIIVQSQYYTGWGQYFEERTDGEVTYDHPNNKVILELITPIGAAKVNAATASLSASGSFQLQGRALTGCGNDAYVNSYNSSGTPDDYCTQAPGSEGPPGDRQPGIEGDVIYGQDIDIDVGTGTSDLYGDLKSGRDVIVSSSAGGGQPDVWGNITFNEDCRPNLVECTARVLKPGASAGPGTGVRTASAINGHLERTVDEIDSENDNGLTGSISGNSIVWSGGTASLGEGRYYLQRLQIPSGNTLNLDPAGGAITIAVEDDIDIEESGTIEVVGDGVVKIYVQGEDAPSEYDGWDMHLRKDSTVTNPGDDATQLRVYGKDDFEAKIGIGSGRANLAKFVGVIYAPPGSTGTGQVMIYGGEVFGGVLTGTTTIDKGSIHYDEALAQKQIISRGAKVIKITYLHISENQVRISG